MTAHEMLFTVSAMLYAFFIQKLFWALSLVEVLHQVLLYLVEANPLPVLCMRECNNNNDAQR